MKIFAIKLNRTDQKASAAVVCLLLFLTTAVQLLAINPQALEYLRRATTSHKSQRLSTARDFLQRAKQIDPDAIEIKDFETLLNKEIAEKIIELNQRAQFFLEAQNIPEAQNLLNEVITLDSSNSFALSRINEISEINQKVEEYQNNGIVIDVNTGRAHDLNLYSAISYLNRARAFFAQGDREKALELVQKVLGREPNYKPALELKEQIEHIKQLEDFLERTHTAFLEGRMRETVEALDKLIYKTPDRFEFYLMRARAHLALKNFSLAEQDLWKYYSYDPSVDKVYPLLADSFYGQEKYLHALGFSKNPQNGTEYRDFSFRLHCYFKQYPSQTLFMVLTCMALIFAGWLISKHYNELQKRLPLGTTRLGLQCAATTLFKSPSACLGELVVLARDINIPWLNYLAGICLFKAGQIEGAQRFLMYSLGDIGLRVRAGYFTGLTRKILKQRIQEADFEEAVLAGLGRSKKSWHPRFIKLIERELIIKYSKDKSFETFEGMAYKLVNHQVEV